jgi:ligand-binding sensor domain-containing protein/AraC-like DNA-binding protein
MPLLLFLMSFFFCQQHLNAQELQASLSHYSTDEGLTSNAISDIVQDSYGYIWISTWNGLCRFDGYTFYNYPTGNSSHIPYLHNRILEISADLSNNIWMHMYDGRIFVLDRKKDMIRNAFGNVKGGNEFKTKYAIHISKKGKIYAIINGKGVYQMQLTNNNVSSQHLVSSSYKICDLTEDSKGLLWLASNKGLIKMNPKTRKILNVFYQNTNITCIYAKGEDIYAGTLDGQIIRSTKGNKAELIKRVFNQEITSIFVDSKNLVWYSTTQQGISRLNTETGSIKSFRQKIIVPEYDLHGGTFHEVCGILWARMNKGGFGYYCREKDTFEYFHNNPDNSWNLSNTLATYLAIPEGVVWLSTNRRGLEKLEILKERIKRTLLEPNTTDLSANEIRAMYYDKNSHQLWIGNKSNGLYIFKGKQCLYINKDSQGKPLGRIYGLMKDHDGNIWMSTKGNGLYLIRHNGKKYTFEHFMHNATDKFSLSSNNVYATTQDANGYIWVATYSGGVNMMIRSKRGKYIFLNKNNIIKSYPHDEYIKVRTLAADSKGNVWVGTSDGILIMHYNATQKKISLKKIENFGSEKQQLASNDIIEIKNDGHDVMWIATNGGGLSRTLGKDALGNWIFQTFGSKNELPSDEVRSITFDKYGNVWFATDHIICSYDIHKHLFTTLSIQDGVDNTMCSEGAAITLNDGRMLFGTLSGYYTVDRNNLVNSHASMLKLKITDFFVNDKLMSPRLNKEYNYYIPDSNYIKLPSRSSVFSFRFASLNYQLQHRVHYQYMLVGFDENWRNAGRDRMVSYSDVPAGEYDFKVKAFLLESPDKYDVRTIHIVVPPYLLASMRAIEIYIILIIAAILSALYYRHYHQLKLKKMRVLKVGPQEIAFKHKDDYDFVLEQLKWLENHYTESNLKIEDMVANSPLSRTSYYNKLKTLVGLSPKEFISDFRLKKAMMYLDNDDCTIAEVAYKTGFNDPVYFTRIFKTKIGITPSKYREKKNNTTETYEDFASNKDENEEDISD